MLAVFLAFAGFIFTRNLIDFPVYYSAGQSLLQGRTDLYTADFALGPVMDYRYPPFFLVAFTPLWLVTYPVAAYLWHLLGVTLIWVSACCLNRLIIDVSPPGKSAGIARAWVVTFFAVAQYYVMILHYGNVHLLAVCLMFIALYMVTRRKEMIPALFLAVAVTIKITPVLILPYFAITRRWKFLGLTIGFVVLLNLAPATYFGFSKNVKLIGDWYQHVVVNQEFHEINGPINLSLKGQLRRYLTRVGYESRVDGDVNYPQVNVARLSPARSDILWKASSVILYALGLILLWWRSDQRLLDGGPGYAMGLGLMISMTLVVGPLTSKIYFIAMLWPVVVLAKLMWRNTLIRGGLLFIALLNLALPLLPGRSTQRFLLAVGVDFYLACLLLFLCAYALAALPSRGAEPRMQALRAATAP